MLRDLLCKTVLYEQAQGLKKKKFKPHYLTEKQLKTLQEELLLQIDPEYDSVIVYRLYNDIFIEKIGAATERGYFIY